MSVCFPWTRALAPGLHRRPAGGGGHTGTTRGAVTAPSSFPPQGRRSRPEQTCLLTFFCTVSDTERAAEGLSPGRAPASTAERVRGGPTRWSAEQGIQTRGPTRRTRVHGLLFLRSSLWVRGVSATGLDSGAERTVRKAQPPSDREAEAGGHWLRLHAFPKKQLRVPATSLVLNHRINSPQLSLETGSAGRTRERHWIRGMRILKQLRSEGPQPTRRHGAHHVCLGCSRLPLGESVLTRAQLVKKVFLRQAVLGCSSFSIVSP